MKKLSTLLPALCLTAFLVGCGAPTTEPAPSSDTGAPAATPEAGSTPAPAGEEH